MKKKVFDYQNIVIFTVVGFFVVSFLGLVYLFYKDNSYDSIKKTTNNKDLALITNTSSQNTEIEKTSKIIVNYFLEGTKKNISESEVIEGGKGEEYIIKPSNNIDYSKYKLVSTPKNASGKMNGVKNVNYYFEEKTDNKDELNADVFIYIVIGLIIILGLCFIIYKSGIFTKIKHRFINNLRD